MILYYIWLPLSEYWDTVTSSAMSEVLHWIGWLTIFPLHRFDDFNLSKQSSDDHDGGENYACGHCKCLIGLQCVGTLEIWSNPWWGLQARVIGGQHLWFRHDPDKYSRSVNI